MTILILIIMSINYIKNIYFFVATWEGVGGELDKIGNRLRYTNYQIEKQAWGWYLHE